MTDQSRIKHHAALMDNMADAVGVDLEQAMLEGRMNMDQLHDAVLTCTGCSCPEQCAHWLARQTTQADTTPDYCRNGDVLGRLAAGKAV